MVKKEKEGFLTLNMMKEPDNSNWSSPRDQDKCREQCLENCSCMAYAYDTGIGCMSWTNKLIYSQQFSSSAVDLYIRVAYSELGKLCLFYTFM